MALYVGIFIVVGAIVAFVVVQAVRRNRPQRALTIASDNEVPSPTTVLPASTARPAPAATQPRPASTAPAAFDRSAEPSVAVMKPAPGPNRFAALSSHESTDLPPTLGTIARLESLLPLGHEREVLEKTDAILGFAGRSPKEQLGMFEAWPVAPSGPGLAFSAARRDDGALDVRAHIGGMNLREMGNLGLRLVLHVRALALTNCSTQPEKRFDGLMTLAHVNAAHIATRFPADAELLVLSAQPFLTFDIDAAIEILRDALRIDPAQPLGLGTIRLVNQSMAAMPPNHPFRAKWLQAFGAVR